MARGDCCWEVPVVLDADVAEGCDCASYFAEVRLYFLWVAGEEDGDDPGWVC